MRECKSAVAHSPTCTFYFSLSITAGFIFPQGSSPSSAASFHLPVAAVLSFGLCIAICPQQSFICDCCMASCRL